MAFFERTTSRQEYGRIHHEYGRLLCDDCAVEEVPFEAKAPPYQVAVNGHNPEDRGYVMQCHPWCWSPRYGAPCHACKREC